MRKEAAWEAGGTQALPCGQAGDVRWWSQEEEKLKGKPGLEQEVMFGFSL